LEGDLLYINSVKWEAVFSYQTLYVWELPFLQEINMYTYDFRDLHCTLIII